MRKVYILGWSGYIGSELVTSLTRLGVEMRLVGRSPGSEVVFDLSQPDYKLLESLQAGDTFVLLSAISSPEACVNNYDYAYKINVSNTMRLINVLLDQGVNVLFASSDVVYGGGDAPVTESDDVNPQFAYAEMKAEVESKFYGHDNFRTVRLSYVWSLNDKFTRFLMRSSVENSLVEVFHPFIRSVVVLDDVTESIVKFVIAPGKFPRVLNLAGPKFLSRVEMVDAFASIRPIKYIVSYPDEDFFIYRPKQILMKSNYLESILERCPADVIDEMKYRLRMLEN